MNSKRIKSIKAEAEKILQALIKSESAKGNNPTPAQIINSRNKIVANMKKNWQKKGKPQAPMFKKRRVRKPKTTSVIPALVAAPTED